MRPDARVPSPHLVVACVCAGVACANVVRPPQLALAALAAPCALAAAGARAERRLALAAVALLVTGLWWGGIRLDALDRSVLAHHVGRAGPAVAIVTGPARRGAFVLRVPAEVRRFGGLELRERVLLELPRGRAPPRGGLLELLVRVRLPRTEQAGFDERGWLRRNGVHVVLASVSARWRLVGRRGGVQGLGDRLRALLVSSLAAIDGERRAVVAGIVLGEDEALSDELRESFRVSGLYHLLAVSGQNVGLLAAGVLGLAWLVGASRWLAEAGVLLAITGYVLAVGWQPSVVRAGVAGCLASLAWLAARPRDRWYFLLVGALALLAWNPYSLLDPGFQLSFAAVAAIFVAVPWLRARLDGYPLPRPLADVVAVSAACGLATAPILWLHFSAVPVFSVVSNALAAPVVAPLLGLGLLAGLVAPLAPSAALALAWVDGWLAAYLATCARAVASLPHAQLTSPLALAALALALAGCVAAARASSRDRRRIAAAAAVVLVAVLVWRLLPERALPPPSGLRISFLDVGQGDAILVQTARASLLVDQGPPEARVAEQLRTLGVRRLALLVLTHPQRDHVGGAAEVLERVQVERVLDPGLAEQSRERADALAVARRRRVPVELARAGRAYRLGALQVRVLWPDGRPVASDDPNDGAVVLLLSYGEIDALLTADAEGHVTTRLRPSPVEILKVAHHGSADPLLPELLRRVRPRIAVVSVGSENDYGHPAPSTMAALARTPGLAAYRTDRDGRVVVESDGERLLVSDER